jgi:hypothetical protein
MYFIPNFSEHEFRPRRFYFFANKSNNSEGFFWLLYDYEHFKKVDTLSGMTLKDQKQLER